MKTFVFSFSGSYLYNYIIKKLYVYLCELNAIKFYVYCQCSSSYSSCFNRFNIRPNVRMKKGSLRLPPCHPSTTCGNQCRYLCSFIRVIDVCFCGLSFFLDKAFPKDWIFDFISWSLKGCASGAVLEIFKDTNFYP